jgi:hypothetical protein
MRVKMKRTIADFPHRRGGDDRWVWGDILTEESNALGMCLEQIHMGMCRGGTKERGKLR